MKTCALQEGVSVRVGYRLLSSEQGVILGKGG